MQIILIDIAIGLVLYTICLFLLIMRDQKRESRRNKNDDDDDEGGLPVSFPPDFDLPPGICLPDDPRVRRIKETDEVLA
ncbi:MAG: hypothetical protein ACJA08_000322 [Cyclobacteriaceae bacterium]|jgi:hypothetical protein